jgi:hypothetical protein
MFSGFHWYAVDGTHLPDLLKRAASYLRGVNLRGSRHVKSGNGSLPATIELLHQGHLDNFYILGLPRNMNYEGMIGLQGYSIGGDVYTNLKESIHSYRDMLHRLHQHPHWGELRPPL